MIFLIVDEKSIESKLLKAVSKLLKEVSPQPERWITGLVKYFKIQNKQWTIGIKGLSLQLSPEKDSDVAENILDALNAAEYLLMKKKQKAVLFIDEAQEISKVNNSQSIEGAIRNFAQQAKYLVIIFSGSNQHMLSHMFGDESRPLYDLCDRVPLDRLSPQVYQPYLNKISKQTWNEPLNNAVFESLMAISECHPKIVYALCKKLWDYCTSKNRGPGMRDVQHVWETYLKLRLKDIKLMLSKLSAGQLNLLIQIALNKHQHITGKAMQSILGISSSAIVQAIAALERHDFIEETSINDYRIIDPSIKSILLKDYKD